MESTQPFSFVTVGLEQTANTPVKGQVELDATNVTLTGHSEVKRFNTLSRGRATRKAAPGPYNASGDIAFNVTPDKCSKLLYATLARLTANTATTGNISHVLRVNNTDGQTLLPPVTVQVKRGATYYVYPGCRSERLVLRPNEEDALTASISLQSTGLQRLYDSEQSDVAVAASDLVPFMFHGGSCSLGGETNENTSGWEITIATGLTTRRVLKSGRASGSAKAGRSLISGSFDLIFDSDAQAKLWLQSAETARPWTPGNALQTLALQVAYTHESGASLTLDIPKAYYVGDNDPQLSADEEGHVLAPCAWEALWDDDEDCDIKLTLVNAEVDSDITGTGTGIDA